MSWWSTSERGYEKGYFITFHRLTRVDLEVFFWGCGFVWVCVLVCVFCVLLVCLFGSVLLFCLRFRDLFSSFAKSNDRRSCHGAHGMGEKQKSEFAKGQSGAHVRKPCECFTVRCLAHDNCLPGCCESLFQPLDGCEPQMNWDQIMITANSFSFPDHKRRWRRCSRKLQGPGGGRSCGRAVNSSRIGEAASIDTFLRNSWTVLQMA